MDRWLKFLGIGCWVSVAAWGTPVLRAQPSIAAAMVMRGGTGHSESIAATLPAPPVSLEDALHAAFSSADVVFTGEVTGIRRNDGAVVVTWQVEDAVRGAQRGSSYDLCEWAGLWDTNGARYLVGQRALVMLHAPSVAGYASPVAGGDGIVPLRGGAVDGVLDLRMLAQHVVVTDAARLRPAWLLKRAGGNLAAGDALQARAAALTDSRKVPGQRPATLRHSLEEDSSEAAGASSAGAATSAVRPPIAAPASLDGAMVLGMLHAWQRAGSAK